jgi:hypothetical protein
MRGRVGGWVASGGVVVVGGERIGEGRRERMMVFGVG